MGGWILGLFVLGTLMVNTTERQPASPPPPLQKGQHKVPELSFMSDLKEGLDTTNGAAFWRLSVHVLLGTWRSRFGRSRRFLGWLRTPGTLLLPDTIIS